MVHLLLYINRLIAYQDRRRRKIRRRGFGDENKTQVSGTLIQQIKGKGKGKSKGKVVSVHFSN
jgi:hypothetical protein